MNFRIAVISLAALAPAGVLCAQSAPKEKESESPLILSPFVVNSSASDDQYTVQKTISATRLATDTADLPFTINALTDSFMRDIAAIDIADALSYLNINAEPNAGFSSNVSSSFVSRGLPADVLVDGFPAANGFVPTARIAVDRVEVLEGPASLLYGTMDPGGVVNLVSKRPPAKARYAFDATVGDYGLRRGTLDVGGPISASGKVGYRLLYSGTEAGSYIVAAGTRRTELAPMLQFNVSPATTINVQYNYVNNRVAAIAANGPAYITLVPAAQNPQGAIRRYDATYWPWQANTRGPGNDSTATSNSGSAELRHRFNAIWNLRLAYAGVDLWSSRKTRAANTLLQPNPAILQAGTDTWAVGGQISHFFQADLVGKRKFRPLTWTLLSGVSYDRTANHASNLNSTATISQNPLNPATWAIPVAPESTFTTLAAKNNGSSNNKAFYTTDQFSFFDDRLLALVGGRWQKSEATATNDLTHTSNNFTLSHATYQAGVVGKLFRRHGPLDFLHLYTSWSQSFVPQNQTLTTAKPQDADGQPLPGSTNGSAPALPIIGEGSEVGLKTSFWNGRLVATADFFRVERANIISNLQRRSATGTVLDIYQVQGGTERVQGEQLNLSAHLFDATLDTIFNYTHFDSAKLVQYDGNPIYVGKRIANTPTDQVGFFVRYNRKQGLFRGAFVGLGGQYRTSFGLIADTSAQIAEAPGYTLLNAVAGYRWRLAGYNYNVQANVANLQNRQLILGIYQETAPRTLQVTFGVSF